MKCKTILVTLLSAIVFGLGCDKDKNAEQQLDHVKAETDKAAQNMRDYTYAQKAEFVKEMRRQMATMNQDLDTLSAKIENSSDTAKADAKVKLQALRDREDKLNKKLNEVENANESNWNDVKSGFDKALEDVKDSFQQSRQWLSDKIAS